jgi:NTE family protein
MAEDAVYVIPPKIGLALGSGLARGFVHLGAVRALKRHGIEPTIISGTSMGAVVGGAYLAGKIDRLEHWAYSLSRFRVLSYLDLKVGNSGLIGGDRLMKLLDDNFGDIRIEDLPYPFAAVAADLVTGHEVWLQKGRLIDALRASFSLPGVFAPAHMNDRWLIDGALVNPVPVSVCQALGATMTIAINASGDIIGKAKDSHHAKTSAFEDAFARDDDLTLAENISGRTKAMVEKIFRKDNDTPSMFGTMVGAMNIIQDRLSRSRLAGDSPDVLISPRVGHIGLMEFDRAEELIDEGEAAVERALPDIKAAYTVLCTQYTRVSEPSRKKIIE